MVGHRTGHKPYVKRWVEAVVKPGEDGAYVHQHLNFISCGKDHGRKAKASNRTMGNPAVRHYRGGHGKRKPWWDCEPVRQSKEQERKPLT